jgi:alpha-galactosidase
MLEVGVHDDNGDYGLTVDEERTHFALWAVSKAPLIIGADLNDIRSESLEILKNKGLIAYNQDPDSRQAKCFIGCSDWHTLMRRPSVYTGRMSTGDTVAVVVNWRESPESFLEFNL